MGVTGLDRFCSAARVDSTLDLDRGALVVEGVQGAHDMRVPGACAEIKIMLPVSRRSPGSQGLGESPQEA